MSKKKYYYATSNTAKGYINFLPTNIKGIEHVIVLNHRAHTLKTAVLKSVIQIFDDVQLEILCSPFGEAYIEGVICREKSFAILINGVSTKELAHVKQVYIEDPLIVNEFSNEQSHCNQLRLKAYAYLSKGLALHDSLEGIYINEMNFSKADAIASQFVAKLLGNIPSNKHIPNVYHRFFGTNTANGPINIVPQLIKDLSQRVYVKGRAGTGKSVFMKKVAKACEGHGFDVELYHCSFDPDSIDMVLVPELDLCVFDSTDPHEFTPNMVGDVIIDLYETTVTPGTDEKYALEIADITMRYKAFLQKGINHLKEAELFQDKIESRYVDVDVMELEEVTNEIIKHIM